MRIRWEVLNGQADPIDSIGHSRSYAFKRVSELREAYQLAHPGQDPHVEGDLANGGIRWSFRDRTGAERAWFAIQSYEEDSEEAAK
jgi:hypothetical protein